MSDAFNSAWLKWAWAVRHANALQVELAAEADGQVRHGYTTRPEYDPKRHCVILRADTVVVSHFIAINAVIGSATGDDRLVVCSLDNCSVTRSRIRVD